MYADTADTPIPRWFWLRLRRAKFLWFRRAALRRIISVPGDLGVSSA
jgi:hypothetical protein